MRFVYALLVSVMGLIMIIFNRFAVEEGERFKDSIPLLWIRPPIWVGRSIVILTGVFFVIFGALYMTGYLQ